MHDLISQYRADVEAQLMKDVTVVEARILADEIENHLRERVAALVELGSTPEAAQLEALSAMGPSTRLCREFRKRSLPRTTFTPVVGNCVLFLVCASIVVFKSAFLQIDAVNLFLVLAWFLSPAFCRRYPFLGVVAGLVLIELLLVVAPGRASFPNDLVGMSCVFLFTLTSYLTGVAVRKVAKSARARFSRNA